MKQSPSWEANRFPVIQEIPLILWNPNFITAFKRAPTYPYFEPARSSAILQIPFPEDLSY